MNRLIIFTKYSNININILKKLIIISNIDLNIPIIFFIPFNIPTISFSYLFIINFIIPIDRTLIISPITFAFVCKNFV